MTYQKGAKIKDKLFDNVDDAREYFRKRSRYNDDAILYRFKPTLPQQVFLWLGYLKSSLQRKLKRTPR